VQGSEIVQRIEQKGFWWLWPITCEPAGKVLRQIEPAKRTAARISLPTASSCEGYRHSIPHFHQSLSCLSRQIDGDLSGVASKSSSAASEGDCCRPLNRVRLKTRLILSVRQVKRVKRARRTRFGWQPQVVDKLEVRGVANRMFASAQHRNGARWAGRAISSLKGSAEAS